MIKGKNYTVHIGNNLDILPTLESNSIDSIVTDPPYELGFMGKKWDSSGIAYNVELWRECLRVLKPGGHMLAFGGTRTWHRIAVSIEDAGFEVRDSIAWMYGSGFPKSLDISKAIDKSDAAEARRKRDLQFVEWMRKTNLSAQKCDEILKLANKISQTSNRSIHYFNEGQPQVATSDMFDILRPYLPEVPDYIEKLVAERTIESQNFKKREIIGQQIQGKLAVAPGQENDRSQIELDITAPATPEAQQWEGWGTALKPAFEPVIVARKPLIGTVAENVLTYGTGGLNIDGSRIGTETIINPPGGIPNGAGNYVGTDKVRDRSVNPTIAQGRWPANVILDPYTAELLDEQSGVSVSKSGGKSGTPAHEGGWSQIERQGHNDTGGASRFFYVAKASKRDRNEGLEELPTKQTIGGGGLTEAGGAYGSIKAPAKNFHPTVKPTTLMEYLIKLVTPPNGLVLDPFTGSGSTGKAALLNGFRFVGCELTEDYIPIIEGRLNHAEAMAEQAKEKEDEALF